MGQNSSSHDRHESKRKKQAKVVMIGLDFAGKSSIMYKMKQKKNLPSTVPTLGFNVEVLKYKRVVFTLFDIGGLFLKTKQLAQHYFEKNQAVIFVIDSTDKARMNDAKQTLHLIMDDQLVSNCKLLVLANKQDLPDAMSVDDVSRELNLMDIKQTWSIQGSSAKTGMGLLEGLDWLSKNV